MAVTSLWVREGMREEQKQRVSIRTVSSLRRSAPRRHPAVAPSFAAMNSLSVLILAEPYHPEEGISSHTTVRPRVAS